MQTFFYLIEQYVHFAPIQKSYSSCYSSRYLEPNTYFFGTSTKKNVEEKSDFLCHNLPLSYEWNLPETSTVIGFLRDYIAL